MQTAVPPFLVIAAILALAPVARTQQQPAPADDTVKGAALLAEARKALGGEDKLAAVTRLQVRGEMRRGQGNTTLEGEAEVFIELPDKFRRNESLSLGPGGPGIDRVEVLNGNDVWDQNGGGGFPGRGFRGALGRGAAGGDQAAPAIDPERLKELQLRSRRVEMARLLLAFLLHTDAPVAWIGTAQSPDGTADVLEVKLPDGPTRLFLESETHMPLMMTWSAGDGRGRGGQGRFRGRGDGVPGGPPQGGAAVDTIQGRGNRGAVATLEMHLSEYKAVNGLKLPHLITRGTSGQTAEEWVIKSYRINPTFKGNTFTR